MWLSKNEGFGFASKVQNSGLSRGLSNSLSVRFYKIFQIEFQSQFPQVMAEIEQDQP